MLNLATKTHPLKIREFGFLFFHISIIIFSGYQAIETNQTIYFTILIYALLFLSISAHEFGHSFFGFLGGDWAVRSSGYLTLDFRKYANPYLTILTPIFTLIAFGVFMISAAVYIREHYIKSIFMRFMTHFGGVLFNALVIVALVYSKLFLSTFFNNTLLLHSIDFVIYMNALLILLNLLPIPPLDGFNILLSPIESDYFKQQFLRIANPLGVFILIYFFYSSSAQEMQIISIVFEFIRSILNIFYSLTGITEESLENGLRLAKMDGSLIGDIRIILQKGISALEDLFI